MNEFVDVISSFIYTAAFIACLWWASSALRELDIPRRLGMSLGVHLLVVLVVGNLVYYPVSRVIGGILAIVNTYDNGWHRAAEVIGALAVLVFIRWLYTRGILALQS